MLLVEPLYCPALNIRLCCIFFTTTKQAKGQEILARLAGSKMANINFDELEGQFKGTIVVDQIYSCKNGKDSNCPECRLALCPGCFSSASKLVGRKRKRGHGPTGANSRECCHEISSLEVIENLWWTKADFREGDIAKPYPRGCFGCLKKYSAGGRWTPARSKLPKGSFILITTCRSTSNSFVEVIICSCLISKSTCHLLRTGTWIRLVLVLWGGCIVNRNSGLGCWEYWVKSIGFFSIMWLYYYSKRSLKKWYS